MSQVSNQNRFTPLTIASLSRAGWSLDYTHDPIPLVGTLPEGIQLISSAERFLREFGNLGIRTFISGWPDQVGSVHFYPEASLRLLDEEVIQSLKRLIGRPFCPIGTASGHTMHILMDDSGASYLLDMDVTVFAPLAKNPDEMLEVLLDGRNGRVDSYELVDGSPSGRILRNGTERDCWGLDSFPNMAPYLPASSWEPARRAPTVLAMVRTAEASLAQSPPTRRNPASIMVTCGGLLRDNFSQLQFVWHTENAIWIRRRAGFQISTPPPGIEYLPSSPGAMIAYFPPPSWAVTP